MNIEGRRGKTKEEAGEYDMRTAGVCMDDVGDRAKWRFRTKVVDPK